MSDKNSHHQDTGAIVGGTVGGIATLSFIIACSIFFFKRRKNRNKHDSAAELDVIKPRHQEVASSTIHEACGNNQSLAELDDPAHSKLSSGCSRIEIEGSPISRIELA